MRRATHWTFATLAGLSVLSCADAPSAPDLHLTWAEAPGGGGTPKVRQADPSVGEQNQTLDVRVLGSGFEDGSVAQWELAGVPSPDVTTLSTRFVSDKELVASISISGSAPLARYDIAVTTPRGKKGVGIEKFEVLSPQQVRETFTTFHRAGDPIHDDGLGPYETIKRRQAAESSIGASGQHGLRLESFSGRSLCISFPAEGPDLDVRSPSDWQDLQVSSGGAVAPGVEYCGPTTMHTRDHLEPGKLHGMDADPGTEDPDDIQSSGGKIVLKEFDGDVSWQWRLLFDDSHTTVNGGVDSNGLCIRYTAARTWIIGTDPTIELDAEDPGQGVCSGVDEWINLIRWRADNTTVHVARFRMPFRYTVIPR